MTFTKRFANITKGKEGIKTYISSNFEFIEHNQITAKDLWKGGIHLTECGKVFSGRILSDRINIFFMQQCFYGNLI